MTQLATNICRIIQDKGLKKGYVAAKAGLNRIEFSKMLHGTKLIRAEHIPAIADALNVTIDELYRGEDSACDKD